MSLTKERENQIFEILKHFPTVQAEKRLDMRKPAEVVDMKPIIKELLAEVKALREEIEGPNGLNSCKHRMEMYFAMLDKAEKERDALKAECNKYAEAMSKLIDRCNELEKK